MRKDWDTLPEQIRKHGFDFHWDNQKVWDLDVPVEEIDIAELEWILDFPFWHNAEGIKYTVSPRQVMTDIDLYPFHKERITAAETIYPIDLMKNQNDAWLILDGVHRLLKLIEQGGTTAKVRKLSRDLIPLIEKKYEN